MDFCGVGRDIVLSVRRRKDGKNPLHVEVLTELATLSLLPGYLLMLWNKDEDMGLRSTRH